LPSDNFSPEKKRAASQIPLKERIVGERDGDFADITILVVCKILKFLNANL
jgi:hypothetical protein